MKWIQTILVFAVVMVLVFCLQYVVNTVVPMVTGGPISRGAEAVLFGVLCVVILNVVKVFIDRRK